MQELDILYKNLETATQNFEIALAHGSKSNIKVKATELSDVRKILTDAYTENLKEESKARFERILNKHNGNTEN